MTKRLVIIHGRDKKPDRETMLRLVKRSLTTGLERVNEHAANKVLHEEIPITFVYYGDINNALLLEKIKENPKLMERMKEVNGKWYVQDDYYDDDLQHLIERPTEQLTKKNYQQLIEGQKLLSLLDEAATVVSPVLSLFDMSYDLIRDLLPDLGAYLNSRVVGSEIRELLQKPLAEALDKDEDIMLISHSMGCMVSYDVLWKFSRMSEYKHLWGKKINVWLTIGNPLGEPAVKKGLYDSNEPRDGRYPKNIRKWINISAVDDYISHDTTIQDDFAQMLNENLVEKITDESLIYNFWRDQFGKCNPHNLFGYLNHPHVANQIAKWIVAEDVSHETYDEEILP